MSKTYGAGAAASQAIFEISLVIEQGEFVSITGPSGCGKSTLLNLIAGYDQPEAGKVFVVGEDLWALNERRRSNLRARQLGFVVQNFDLLPRLTIEENILVRLGPCQIRGRVARRRAVTALDQVGLPLSSWQRYPSELSGGEQQRAAMARALVAKPRLLLADEPTGNLDSANGMKILDLLRDLSVDEQMSVVMVTHDAFAATFGHRTICLRDGRIEKIIGPAQSAGPMEVCALRPEIESPASSHMAMVPKRARREPDR